MRSVPVHAASTNSTPAPVAPAAILPLRDVRPGMTGEALTVFSGTTPERVKLHVVSVLHDFLPKQDLILVHLDDPRTDKTGVAAGMSGSPCYIDGKVIGAIAYAWSFSKEPLAGVTPIESMLAERSRPERRRDQVAALPGLPHEMTALVPSGDLSPVPSSVSSRVPSPVPSSVSSRVAIAATDEQSRLVRVAVPLAVSGLSDKALAEVAEEFKPFGLMPVRAGAGGGGVPRPAPPVVPGGSIAVSLVRGDVSATGTGTVTYVDGHTVFAFGHPMLGAGEVNLPLVGAEIHTIMAGLSSSFKMASPLGDVGVLLQDRQPCIWGDLQRRTTMMPLVVTVRTPDAPPRSLHTEVARDKRLTPVLTGLVMSAAASTSEPDPVEVAVGLHTRITVRGLGQLDFDDQIASNDGLSARLLASAHGVRALSELLANPFSPVFIERMDVDVEVTYRHDFAEIVNVELPSDEVVAEQPTSLRMTLRPYQGSDYEQSIPLVFPAAWSGRSVKIEVASGAQVKPDVARPESLQDFVDTLRTYWTAASLVVSVSTGESGAALRGRLLRALPPSGLDTLRSVNASGRSETYRVARRFVTPFPKLVAGRKEVTVFVRGD